MSNGLKGFESAGTQVSQSITDSIYSSNGLKGFESAGTPAELERQIQELMSNGLKGFESAGTMGQAMCGIGIFVERLKRI